MPLEDASQKTSIEMLEASLTALIADLDPDLERVRNFAPRFLSLFTEMALSVAVLEHALRKKGVVEPDDLTVALEEAQAAMQRIRRRGTMSRPGTA